MWVLEREKYKHVVRMQMNFALLCELREKKKSMTNLCAAMHWKWERTSYFPLTLSMYSFSAVTYSCINCLIGYKLIAKMRSAFIHHNDDATHNERAFSFRENSAFALSHSSGSITLSSGKRIWSYKALEWNFHVHSRSICKRLIRRDDNDVVFYSHERCCAALLWSNM